MNSLKIGRVISTTFLICMQTVEQTNYDEFVVYLIAILCLDALRKQRFERVTKNLKVTRVFSTLVEEMKVIRSLEKGEAGVCTEVMVPVKHSERSPVLLLMGGGMGAGKSTVLKEIMKQ